MSSYNKIEKITNNLDIDEIVSLSEYIIFEDEEAKQKQVVFKFRNNVNQTLQDIEFSVVEYDNNNEIIEELVLGYKELNAKELSEFVPNAKCKVNYECRRIRVKVSYCRFNKTTWTNGVFKSIPFKQTQNVSNNVVKNTNTEKVTPQKTTQVKVKPFKLKYLKQFNRIRFAKFVTFILSIALLVAIGYFAIVQKSYVTVSIYGDFELGYNYTDNTICINKYTGESPHVVIPSQIGGSRVNEIGPDAFKETGIISIEIKSSAMTVRSYAFKDCVNLREIKGNITNIDSGAFSGCINLQEITMTTCRIIARDAFRDCVNLRTVNVPQCNVSPNAFYGCTSLSSLTFQKTESLTIGGIFGVGNSDLKALTFLKVGFDEITNEFVAFNRSIYTISLKSSCNAADNLTDNTNIGTIKRH